MSFVDCIEFLVFILYANKDRFTTTFSILLLLLLLLSCFSRVQLCATHRRQRIRLLCPGILKARTLEWVAISFSNSWKWKVKGKSLSRVRLSDPMDCSPPGSSVHGIFQARVLEWGAIAFSNKQVYRVLISYKACMICTSICVGLLGNNLISA